jgi:hypothetical protein
VAGCGSTATERADQPSTKPTPCTAPAGAGIAPRKSAPTAADILYLTEVRIDHDRCAERVSFTFDRKATTPPGYAIEYTPAKQAQTEDASGRHIPVAGSAFLVVHLMPAMTARADGERLVFTYTGPRRLRASGTRYVDEVVKTGDFEAVVTWAIGLDAKRPYRVVPTSSPPGLSIEIG